MFFSLSFLSLEFSKQVKQKVTDTQLIVQNLEEEVTYTFTVRAQTKIDFGPAVIGNVTTGPQEGSPNPPRDLVLARTGSSIDMHWVNGQSGKGPILGYYIESKKRGIREIHLKIIHLVSYCVTWLLEKSRSIKQITCNQNEIIFLKN